jgi:hypothetical protein
VAVNVEVGSGKELQRQTLTADDLGLVTFKGFGLTSAGGNKLKVTG